ncbi:MAG: hypothetical protein K1X67_21925 [Fimbriimonadaceae bacterium]|nr:hypothetical protein [Fimbriimonadaceae bacterium]
MSALTFWQRERIRAGYDLVRPKITEFSRRFYDHLFSAHPEYRNLFPEDMTAQLVRFVQFWEATVGMVDRLDECEPTFRKLGQTHREYGIKPSDFQAVGEALLATLPEFLGQQYTPEDADAWATLYTVVSSGMISNMEENAA